MELTQKERQVRGLDTLGLALRPLVDAQMQQSVGGRPWLPLYEAKESARRGHPFRADLDDPRLLLRMVRFERGVFTEVDATQRAWIDELIQASNRAAHSLDLDAGQVDRALDTMALLARSLGLVDAATEMVALRVLGASLTMSGGDRTDTPDDDAPGQGELSAAEAADPAPVHRVSDVHAPAGARALSVRAGELDVEMLVHEALNYSLVHNGASPVIRLAVHNRGAGAARDVQVDIGLVVSPGATTSPVAAPLSVHLGEIGPEQRVEAPTAALAWQASPAPFLEIDESVLATATLSVRHGDGATLSDETPVRLLPADEWWARGASESLVSFVRPNRLPAGGGAQPRGSRRVAPSTRARVDPPAHDRPDGSTEVVFCRQVPPAPASSGVGGLAWSRRGITWPQERGGRNDGCQRRRTGEQRRPRPAGGVDARADRSGADRVRRPLRVRRGAHAR
ncbi:MAG TPA: Swt1 family HEPN domain-containing protein [Cellulomonas sp.]